MVYYFEFAFIPIRIVGLWNCTAFHLVLVPFVSLRQIYGTPYLLTFCNLKLLILLDII